MCSNTPATTCSTVAVGGRSSSGESPLNQSGELESFATRGRGGTRGRRDRAVGAFRRRDGARARYEITRSRQRSAKLCRLPRASHRGEAQKTREYSRRHPALHVLDRLPRIACPSCPDGLRRLHLPQQAKLIGVAPVLDDHALRDSLDVDPGQRDAPSGRQDAEERSMVDSFQRPPPRNLVPL